MCDREREGEQEGGLAGTYTGRHPDCAPLSSFPGGEDKRGEEIQREKLRGGGIGKKGPGIRACRDGGSRTSPPLAGAVWTGERLKRGGAADSSLGFPATQREGGKRKENSLSLSSSGLVALLRFQVCFRSVS